MFIFKFFLIEFIRILKLLLYLIIYILNRKKILIVKAAVKTKFYGVRKFNWGDDLNFYLLSLISNKKILFLPHGKFIDNLHIPSFLGIGSIISFYNLDNTYIIGSGLINSQCISNINGKPHKIYFVRGPLTRNALISNNIDCPNIFGDLALTLPLFYNPKVKKIYRIGLVLHILDEKTSTVQQIIKKYPQIKIIHMNKYNKWTDIIDEINSCEVIFSSALHGLITSEAYKVCCQWVSFKDKKNNHWNTGYEFKYWDFYESIGKTNMSPLFLDGNSDLYSLAEKVESSWNPTTYNPQILIDALPKDFK